MTGIVFSGLTIFILLATGLGYMAAKQSIIRNKKLVEDIFLANCLLFVCGLISALLWFMYAGSINEFLLFGGMLFIIGITLTCAVVLTVILIVRQRKWMQPEN
ncbi:hypothetical protein SAMN05216353_13926 [Halobacillus alkaliphilus]|uniref:Uncharacterized protein n=1 Tax=Halobacillus alkaliphilus TaxID=396056 RepID=A0A1I2RFM6_9BACI|nr:hypothetical protein [Halobacillus alkaliphilus]SFG38863.1 hypothetical protein SAMN05216353_13926 [Halobacillus alkaliphilus]